MRSQLVRSSSFAAVAMAPMLLVVGCAGDDPSVAVAAPMTPATATTLSEVASTTTTLPPTALLPTTASDPPSASPRSQSPLALDPARFRSSIETLDEVVIDRVIGSSWREGCPLPLDRFRYVEVTHHTNDGATAIGELVVDADVADDIVTIFAMLYEAEFPIESMRLVDDFGADDVRSMQANNTSAFNCRFVADTSTWSWHAYGRAIDINPLVNPYVTPAGVQPPEGADFVDRSQQTIGMIQPGDAVTSAFAELGWEWGGNWRSGHDYQHFDRAAG